MMRALSALFLFALCGSAHAHIQKPIFQPCPIAHRFTISMTGLQPTIEGMTDLPDGTELVILIFKPWLPDGQQRLAAGLSACENDCMPAKGPSGSQTGSPALVKNGHFSVGPFSFNNSPFHRGIFYPVEIAIIDRTAYTHQRTGDSYEEIMRQADQFMCSGYFSEIQIDEE